MQRFAMMLGFSLLACSAAVLAAQAPPEVEALYASVNAVRAQAGLPALALDPVLSSACMQHARYMVANRGTPAMAGLSAHRQRPDLPGASAAGAECAVHAVLAPVTADLPSALRAWMGSLYHRRPFLSPRIRRMGVGFAPLPEGGIAVALMLPEDPSADPTGWPVLWPVDGQADVPLDFGSEVPSPIPRGGQFVGYPVTLFFPDQKPVAIKSAKLRANNEDVPVYLSSPAAPVTEFSRYGVVSLIPKEPLLPGTTYSVTIVTELDGRTSTVSGSFKTVRLAEVAADDPVAIAQAVGVPSDIAGKVAYAGRLSDGTVYLQLAIADKAGMVSVMVDPQLWRELARNADPLTWRDRYLRVQATPQRVGPAAINLQVGVARQLRAVASD